MQEEDAPIEWINKLEKGSYIPYFTTEDGFYMPEKEVDYDPLIKAVLIVGEVDYYCAVIESTEHRKKNKVATVYSLF